MTSELLQQVRVIDPVSRSDRSSQDVLIADGVIKAVAPQISDYPDNTAIIDCQGLVLGPGLVDLYSHSGEPGFEDRETLATLLAAGTAGGFTRLNILPDTTPPLDDPAGVVRLLQKRMGGQGDGGTRGIQASTDRQASKSPSLLVTAVATTGGTPATHCLPLSPSPLLSYLLTLAQNSELP